MNGQALNDLNTEILQGRGLDITDFLIRANMAKDWFEGERNWRKLVKIDTSKTSLSSDTYATSKALPTDFRTTLPRRTLKLVSGSTKIEYTEMPYEDFVMDRDVAGNYAIDHFNNVYYLAGTVTQTYTHYFPYIATSPDITASTEWIFPDWCHPALAYEVAAMVELGEDYDDINARNANANHQVAALILKRAIKWDDSLQRSALGV